MRITHKLIANTVIRNVNRNLKTMSHYQDMLSSGKSVSKPSDDPVKIARIMGYTSSLKQNEQYLNNIHAAQSWINTTEDALIGINEVLQRARELAVAGASDAQPPDARNAIAMEVDELVGVLVQMGNSSYGGRYVFAGYKTTSAPFERDKTLLATNPTSVTYQGDEGKLAWEVAPGVTITGNIDGKSLFMDSQIYEHMEKLVSSLHNNDSISISDALGDLSDSIDYILDKRSALGAIRNGLEISQKKTDAHILNLTGLRSKLEDIDFAETFMHFSTMETLYNASLSAGARIMMPSLMDFLR